MRILVTVTAGFIGSFLCKRLLETTNDEIKFDEWYFEYYVRGE